ncbi:MAG: hypothetical protein HYV26_19735 [Candidatus Hydrogenedentes bacterium]|nr:hypothetical protein [Candidatus Hydrogenedentota bacterium]MBI3118911.1 hypothetical protein [Candidatus Hydrogenedentota bacterium]
MLLDVLNQVYQAALALLIPIPLDNIYAKLYVILDILSKIFLFGNDPANGGLDFLPF